MENQLLEQYYQSILLLQEKEEIVHALPKPDYKCFFQIISGLIILLQNEIQRNKDLLEKEEEEEIREYIKEDINILRFKEEVCNDLLKKGKEEERIEQEADNKARKNIVYATTDSGNIYFEKDLKNITKEYIDGVKKCLKHLEEGIQEDNATKAKTFTNNVKLAGLHEIKDFQIRILYRILSPDTVYVQQVRIKKDNNSLQDREEIITRSQQTDRQYKRLKEKINDELEKMKLLEEHQKIHDTMVQTLNQMSGDYKI